MRNETLFDDRLFMISLEYFWNRRVMVDFNVEAVKQHAIKFCEVAVWEFFWSTEFNLHWSAKALTEVFQQQRNRLQYQPNAFG